MSEQQEFSITDLKQGYDLLREKYELEHDLERMKYEMQDDIANRQKRVVEKQRQTLLSLDLKELIQKLEFENNQLQKNLDIIQNEKSNTLSAKLSLSISSLVGIASLILAVLPMFKKYSNLPQILISICLIVFFTAALWIYNNWNNLKAKKDKNHVLYQKLIEADKLHDYVSEVLKRYKEGSTNISASLSLSKKQNDD